MVCFFTLLMTGIKGSVEVLYHIFVPTRLEVMISNPSSGDIPVIIEQHLKRDVSR